MTIEQQIHQTAGRVNGLAKRRLRRVAMFTSCDSFEGFYGGTFGIDRETYLREYRNDFVWEYAKGLQENGHEVIIYILSYGASQLHHVSDGLSVRFLHLPYWLRGIDSILWRARNLKHGSSVRDQVAYMAYGHTLQTALLEDEIDVLYHQEIWTPRFDVLVKRTTIPVIGADHGAVYENWQEDSKRRSLKLAACLICQSNDGLKRAMDFGGNAVLMSNGVNTDFFVHPNSVLRRPKTILAVGRLVEEQKRFADLLRALCLLPEFSLVLVGSGPDETKLKRLATELGIANRVCFKGYLSDREELRRLYQECGVFVSTSSWEAVALVMLEAMSCGAPVVATRIPSFVELLSDGFDGLLVSVGSPHEVAEAVRVAYDRQVPLGIQARETVVRRYSSSRLYLRLSELIEALDQNANSTAVR